MNRIGLDPNTIDLKFLGDSYMENDMLTRSLKELGETNSYLKSSPTESYQDQIDRMYANIDKNLQDDLGLKLGEPLTTEQQNNLDKDIIWYVKQDIEIPYTTKNENGNEITKTEIIKDVLVPQIYLSKENQDKLNKNLDILNQAGSMIAGNNIVIQGQPDNSNNNNSNSNSNNNNSTLNNSTLNNSALNNSILNNSALNNSTLNNSGTIKANNNLIIQTDTINNITTSISRSNHSPLEGESNGQDFNRSPFGEGQNNNQANQINQIKQTNSNNTATLSAGNNLILDTGKNGTINNISGNIKTTNKDSSLHINTGDLNNITHTQQETNSYTSKNYEYKNISTKIGDTGTIASSGNLIINAENDINLKGADIIANNDAEITTNNGNINVDIIEDYNYTYQKTKNKGSLFGQTKTTIQENESLKNNSSNVQTNGNLLINSKNNINIIGSNINARGDAELNAENDVNIISSVDTERNYKEVEKDGFAYNVLSINENLKMTNNKTNIDSGENFIVNSLNNVNFVGVNVNAENGHINAGNEFNLFAVQNYEYDYSFYMKERIDWGVLLGSATIGVVALIANEPYTATTAGLSALNAIRDKKKYVKESYYDNKTQVSSNLIFNNLFDSYSNGNTNIASSNIVARNKNSQINTSDLGVVNLITLYNIKQSLIKKGKYTPAINIGYKTDFGDIGEPTKVVEEKSEKRDLSQYDEYLDKGKSGLSYITNKTNDFIAEVFYNVISWNDYLAEKFPEDKIKKELDDLLDKAIKMSIKEIANLLDEKLNESSSNNINIENKKDDFGFENLMKFCDNCKIREINNEKIISNTNSTIKFGE